MERTFKTWRDPYGCCFSVSPKEITIRSGVTVLVGCNGSGKTTLLRNIKDELENNNIACSYYDNLTNGGSKRMSSFLYNGDIDLVTSLMSSSEGEGIKINISTALSNLRDFFETGISITESPFLRKACSAITGKERSYNTSEYWLLFDATDSGLSIDNIVELKQLFRKIIELYDNVFILISANEYELTDGMRCFDVNKGKYLTFDNYNSYKKFILNSRKLKDKRTELSAIRLEKKREKEIIKLKTKLDKLIERINNNSRSWLSCDYNDTLRELRGLSVEEASKYPIIERR